jgi:hypothetical protein
MQRNAPTHARTLARSTRLLNPSQTHSAQDRGRTWQRLLLLAQSPLSVCKPRQFHLTRLQSQVHALPARIDRISHLIRLDAGCRCQCCHLITWGGGRDEVPDTPPFDLDLAQTKIVREDKITLVRPSLPRQRNNLFIRSFLICYRSPHFF